MSRKEGTLTVSMNADTKAILEDIALEFGCTWGLQPNISALLKAIAAGDLVIYESSEVDTPTPKTKQAQSAIRKIHEALDHLSSLI